MKPKKLSMEQLQIHYSKEALFYFGSPNYGFMLHSIVEDVIDQHNNMVDEMSKLSKENKALRSTLYGSIAPQQLKQKETTSKRQPRSSKLSSKGCTSAKNRETKEEI